MIKELLLAMNIAVLPDVTLHETVLEIAKDIRSITSMEFTITSNFRTPEKQAEVGTITNSKHLCGAAIDIRSWDLAERDIIILARHLNKDKYDVVQEFNPPHIHIEIKNGCN